MKYKTEFRLKKGFRIHIDGIPYEYLGNGVVGTNTDLESVYLNTDLERPDDTITKYHQDITDEAMAREKQLKQMHIIELDTISCMSIEQFVVWRDQRKERPTIIKSK